MPVKRFLVKVELVVKKVSCPGVWLCSNGKVSLQLAMLDSTIQTESYKPVFPIGFNEKFIFYKTFSKERRLNELQRSLGREWLCAELIQWKNCDEGVVLAKFQTTLDDLLYPSAFRSSTLTGTEVDLLMEPTKLFPGTISPKLELRSKTTIEETYCNLKQKCLSKSLPKPSCFTYVPPRKLHPKRVCHTIAYSKAQQRCPNTKKDRRPAFKYRRPEDDLILRLNPNKVVKDDILRATSDLEFPDEENNEENRSKACNLQWCYCGESIPLENQEDTGSSFVKTIKSSTKQDLLPEPCPCSCDNQHEPYLCPVCSKYECTFSTSSTRPIKEFLSDSTNNRSSNLKLCSYCRYNLTQPKARCECGCGDMVRPSEKKVCFCIPEVRARTLAQRLHERLRNTLESGAAGIENCLRNCEACE